MKKRTVKTNVTRQVQSGIETDNVSKFRHKFDADEVHTILLTLSSSIHKTTISVIYVYLIKHSVDKKKHRICLHHHQRGNVRSRYFYMQIRSHLLKINC